MSAAEKCAYPNLNWESIPRNKNNGTCARVSMVEPPPKTEQLGVAVRVYPEIKRQFFLKMENQLCTHNRAASEG